MKVLIIEDEILAAERLESLIKQYDATIEIVEIIDSVEDTVIWLTKNDHPDLIFLDIQLADGLSFEIFEQTTVNSPIVFTTAYDEYAVKAFKVNSIDYLLKPIDLEDLTKAFIQYKKQYPAPIQKRVSPDLVLIQQAMQMLTKQYKTRFIVKAGNHLNAVPVENISYFFSEHKATWLQTATKKYLIDYTLEQIEGMLDPTQFFRLNRKYLVIFSAIRDVISYSNSRLKVTLVDAKKADEQILISREKVSAFKAWLDQ